MLLLPGSRAFVLRLVMYEQPDSCRIATYKDLLSNVKCYMAFIVMQRTYSRGNLHSFLCPIVL